MGCSLPFLPLFPFQPSRLARLLRNSILSALEDTIDVGHLTFSDHDGTRTYGHPRKCHDSVHLSVINDSFWLRILFSGDLGFSEAYMIGDIQVSSLKSCMNLWLDNQDSMHYTLSSTFARLSSTFSACYNSFLGQTRAQARLNAIASYDQSNELFKAFLSQEMMYSCALWSDAEGGVRGDLENEKIPRPTDLEVAQLRKIRHVLDKLRLKPGHRLLEFGSGWGALAIEAAKNYGCQVDTLTLSIEQKTLADERIRSAGLQTRVRVHLMDYREIPSEFEKAFDAFVSIEMVEHVGPKHYDTYFKLVDFALKPNGATAVVSASTFPESRYSSYQPEDFMRKYMWPNSSLPSATALINAAQTGTRGRFMLDGVENHAAHYPRTLREWSYRLDARLSRDMLTSDYPSMRSIEEFEVFKRKWHYLFAYAGAGFSKGYISCHMLTFVRPNDAPAVRTD